MCGIVGIVAATASLQKIDVANVIHSLKHRGPDACGTWCSRCLASDRSVWLGHTRLAIIDLSDRGVQPMADPRTGNRIVYNGEIYNFAEVRRQLRTTDFRSDTDTEVLLAAYAERGSACLDMCVGLFAFAIWDQPNQRLFLARDRLGIKSLYFYESDDCFVFASEVRTLLATGLVPAVIEPFGLESYLAYGAVQGPHTILQDVKCLAPGHY